jgi:hypothetical protein
LISKANGVSGDVMRYLPPFDVIKKPVAISVSKGQTIATASYEDLLGLIKHLLSVVDVDADWYLEQYPDVREAIAQKKTTSAKQHFIDDGYFEGRLPYLIEVDEKWYLEKYPDVATSVRRGHEPSGQSHFLQGGYREGRMPWPIPSDTPSSKELGSAGTR